MTPTRRKRYATLYAMRYGRRLLQRNERARMGSDCTLCPLHREALTVCVPGRGNPDAKILLVGQNPGPRENTLGEAFIGKSGKLLDEMLLDAGYNLDDVFRTNAVKCITPVEKGTFSERAPMTEEIDACREHLVREIHAMKPDVIIALGDVALRSLTRLSGIGNKRGKSFPLHKSFAYDCEVFPTYHSAYVMRVPMSRNTVVADFRRIRDRGMEQTPIQWEWVKPLPKLLWPVYAQDFVALDIETIDGDGKITPNPTQVALAWGVDTVKCVVALMPYDFGIWPETMIHHNGLDFDLPKLGRAPSGYDTMYLAHLIDENQPLGLEPLCVKYLGVRGWKEDEFAPLGSDELAAYNARDAVNTLRLFFKERELLGPRIKIYEQILLPARLALNECSRRGLWIDGQAVEAMCVKVEADIERFRTKVKMIASETIPFHEQSDFSKFNPNSIAQVAVILQKMGIELPRTRKTGALKVDKGVLQAHPQSGFCVALLAYREATKTKSTYVTPYARAAASGNHRMHPEYTLIRTVVGRTSARRARNPVEGLDPGTNVQNLDRDLEFFGAPPGKVFVKADYSALHFRLAAWCAGARSILDRYAKDPNWDPHRFFAARFYRSIDHLILERTVTKEQRQVAKSANFSQLYLGDEHTLQNYAYKMGIELELPFCRALHVAWHATFPEFLPWYQRVWDQVVEKGYAETAVGRRRNFGDIKLLNRAGRAAAHREAVNFLVLGLEPDIALLGLSECQKAGLPVNGFFHDCVSLEVDSRAVFEDNKDLITRCMIDRPLAILRDEFNCQIDVPLAVEFTVYDKETTSA
jgi:uracil-DNA glycosylase family 4